MSESIEFGSKSAADTFREQYTDHLCTDDDKRTKTVTLTSDAPDHIVEQAERMAFDAAAERENTAGQIQLSDHELNEIDFSEGRASVPHAQSVKGIAADAGVDDWLAHYDAMLTVDEHRDIMEQAAREDQGRRMDAEDDAVVKAGQASRRAQAEECNHAEGHCENGEPAACEFLQQTCGYSDEQVSMLLGEKRDDDTEQSTLSGKQAGAYSRALGGYKGALASLRELLDAVREERRHAERAWSAMAAIREDIGKEIEQPRRLHDLLDAFGDLPDEHRLSTLHEHMGDEETEVIEMDDQRDLEGNRANDQARLAGGERGARAQGEVEETMAENPGGLMADERESTETETETTQQKPDAFQVAEGGQRTL